jgi:oxepin-CoA hydrolase/3-oxo-5,6-dehydrosuberyl-CoA semialdehyde dehydrogenase
VATLVTKSPVAATQAVPPLAALHGRLHMLDREAAAESTGHGSPLPLLKHGGPGRAGGGEELGGLRAVTHYLQRAAVQGSPTMLTAVTGEYVRGGAVIETGVHPFRRHFEEMQIGESLLTHRRTVGEADMVNFGGMTGDYFYMHFDDEAAKASPSASASRTATSCCRRRPACSSGPAPGPVLANYGLDTLRFVKPVAIGDTIQARLTCKRKIDRTSATPRARGRASWPGTWKCATSAVRWWPATTS